MDTGLEHPRYTEAARSALEAFPVRAVDLALVAISENVTFRVTTEDERSYVLRLHRPGYCSLEELESERVWTKALRASGVAAPDAMNTRGGAYYTQVGIPGTNEQRYAGLTTWQNGIPLYEFLQSHQERTERAELFHRFGEIVAALHQQSSGWTPPPGFFRRRLDTDGLLGENPFWGRFWEHPALQASEQNLLLQARNRLRTVLNDYGENPASFSLIHADLTPENIIYDGENLAVIDFDDAAWGWHIYDLASVLIECRNAPDADLLHSALLDGYQLHRTLSQADLDMLPTFLLIRGMAIIGWYLQRPEHADDPELEDIIKWTLRACRMPGTLYWPHIR